MLQMHAMGWSKPNPPTSDTGCSCTNNCQLVPENTIIANGCENGEEYFSGHCYTFSAIKKTAWEAFMACKAIGAELVEIETSNEDQFLTDYIGAHYSTEHFWIGLTDVHNEGDWRWLASGKPALYTDWDVADGQPDNHGEGEECTIIRNAGHWNDVDCWEHYFQFVCESAATISILPVT